MAEAGNGDARSEIQVFFAAGVPHAQALAARKSERGLGVIAQ